MAAWSVLWHWATEPPLRSTPWQPHRGFSQERANICFWSIYFPQTRSSEHENQRFRTHILSLNPQQELQEVSTLSRRGLAEVRSTVARMRMPTFEGEIHAAQRALDTAGIVAQLPSAAKTAGGPGPRKVDTSGVSYAALVSVAEFSASKTSGAERLHQECRRRVL